VLTREGDSGREFFVVVDGRARVMVGDRGRIAALGPGASFGEMSLLDQRPRSATVEAETDMQLLVLDARSFSSLLEDAPSVARKVLVAMAGRLRLAEQEATHSPRRTTRRGGRSRPVGSRVGFRSATEPESRSR
jgi:CRP/FNR family cyclic AMP-dependent transcriptional regulator